MRAGLATSYQQLIVVPNDARIELTFDPVTLRTDLDWRARQRLPVCAVACSPAIIRYNVLAQHSAPRQGRARSSCHGRRKKTFEATDGGIQGIGALVDRSDLAAHPRAPRITGGLRLNMWFGVFSDAAPDAFAWVPAMTLRNRVQRPSRPPSICAISSRTADEWSESLGNPDLSARARVSRLTSASNRQIGDDLRVELQGYYKILDDLVSPTGDIFGVPYDNEGVGNVVGGELLVRWNFAAVDGWLSYTLSRSVRTDRAGSPERPFSFDQTHVLALVLGVDLGAMWKVGARFRFATGNPFTPLTAAYYDAGSDVWVPRALGAPLSGRLDDYLQLDLRVQKTWIFDAWRLKFYVEVNNATNQENTEAAFYNDDYSKREDILGLPIIPSVGLRGSW